MVKQDDRVFECIRDYKSFKVYYKSNIPYETILIKKGTRATYKEIKEILKRPENNNKIKLSVNSWVKHFKEVENE